MPLAWSVKAYVTTSYKVQIFSVDGYLGSTLGSIAGTLLDDTAGSVVSQGASSVKTADAAGVWIVGMRYKIIDARTTQQVAQRYAEDKLEVGSASTSVLG